MKTSARISMALLMAVIYAFGGGDTAMAKVRSASFNWTVKNIKLTVNGPVTIHSNSNKPRVEVTLTDKESDRLRIAYDESTLEVGQRPGDNTPPRVTKVEIWTDGLRSVQVYGSSDVDLGTVDDTSLDLKMYGQGSIKAKRLDITSGNFMLYGMGSINIDNIDGTSMRYGLAGQGNIVVGYQNITTLDAVLSGMGVIDLGRIDATGVDINLSGQGNIKVSGDATTARLFCNSFGHIDYGGLSTTRITYTDTTSGVVSSRQGGGSNSTSTSTSTSNGGKEVYTITKPKQPKMPKMPKQPKQKTNQQIVIQKNRNEGGEKIISPRMI